MNLGLKRSLGGSNTADAITHILECREVFVEGVDGGNTILLELSFPSVLRVCELLQLKEGEQEH